LYHGCLSSRILTLAANQDSGTITVFRSDPLTGPLAAIGRPLAVSSPVCVEKIAAPQRSRTAWATREKALDRASRAFRRASRPEF
jgi:hypothetical protein